MKNAFTMLMIAGATCGLAGIAAALSALPAGDFSFIYETGRREMDEKGLPETSAWAAKFSCGQRGNPESIVDTKAGYIYDRSRQNPPSPAWGLMPRPGTAQVQVYPDCKDGRVVADVVGWRRGAPKAWHRTSRSGWSSRCCRRAAARSSRCGRGTPVRV
jgi:hypothetical protein